MSLLSLKHINKVYRSDHVQTIALKDISFEVNQGEFLAIMGPSGSGKSTLMHLIGALDIPTSGEYRLKNQLVNLLSSDELAKIRNKEIGFVFQSFNLLPRLSAIKNVMVPMMYGAIPKTQRLKTARHLLKSVDLDDRQDYLSNQLSGGQQQRVAIARALAMNPSLILADEPTGNIASEQAAVIMQLFSQLNHRGHTIIMITHDPDVAAYAQRIIAIKDGLLTNDLKT